jgi:DNA (cytosine-5)-methyltransferase 1
MADGIGGVGHAQWWITGNREQGTGRHDESISRERRVQNNGMYRHSITDNHGNTMQNDNAAGSRQQAAGSRQNTCKPLYRVPSMAEINAIKWNGFKVASTFSGCGGSCLGYRMAGFRVVWANEFVPAAQNSYRANMTKDCHLDCRDIKVVQPRDILGATGLAVGELDLLDGSPPCQAFSTAGKREKGWGHKKKYEHGASQCNETLFSQYIRLLRGLKPKVFVAENVSGLVKGTCKGMFLDILRDMKASGYLVVCRVCDAQWLGVPQIRQRTIFVGVREDLNLDPCHPKPLTYQYSVRDALPETGKVVHDTAGAFAVRVNDGKRPSDTITCSSKNHYKVHKQDEKPCKFVTSDDSFGARGTVVRKFTIAELKRICAFPNDFILTGSYSQQWERLGNSVPPLMMKHIAIAIRDGILVKADKPMNAIGERRTKTKYEYALQTTQYRG